MLCGSSCVKYIFDNINYKPEKFKTNMFWITELAICLKKSNLFHVKLFCNNSNLYNDYLYYINEKDLSFEGFKYISKALDNNIKIEEIEPNENQLINEIKNSDYVITCVDSKKFNNDLNMKGSHFIILSNFSNDYKVKVINPIKDKYEIKYLEISYILKCIINNGSWRLCVRRKN